MRRVDVVIADVDSGKYRIDLFSCYSSLTVYYPASKCLRLSCLSGSPKMATISEIKAECRIACTELAI